MSYTIHIRVIQSKPSAWFNIVEKTVWHYANGGEWSEVDGEQTLSMGGSGTSGTLRFKNPQGEYFVVALGIHNYKRWCDILVDLPSSDTGVKIHPSYYNSNDPHHQMLWKQLPTLQKTTCSGAQVEVNYYKEEGHTLWATIIIS